MRKVTVFLSLSLPLTTRCTFGEPGYQAFWVGVWVRVDMVLYSLLPCAVLLVSNAVLCWTLAASVRAARQTLSAAVSGPGGRGGRAQRPDQGQDGLLRHADRRPGVLRLRPAHRSAHGLQRPLPGPLLPRHYSTATSPWWSLFMYPVFIYRMPGGG